MSSRFVFMLQATYVWSGNLQGMLVALRFGLVVCTVAILFLPLRSVGKVPMPKTATTAAGTATPTSRASCPALWM